MTTDTQSGTAPADPPPAFTGSQAGEEREVSGMTRCWCPAGRFTMGSPPGEPERRPGEDQVEVTLTRGFWAGKHEVTQGQWQRVAGDFPGRRTTGDELPSIDQVLASVREAALLGTRA